MLVNPDVEKWTADKEFYNLKYLNYIKGCWIREVNAYNKRLAKVVKPNTIEKYTKWRSKAYDSLFKLDIIIEQL